MIRIRARVIGVGLLAAGLLLGTVALVSADDETNDVEIKVQAPLEQVTCGTTSSITVLGLPIDITNASTDAEGQDSGGSQDGSNDGQGGSDDGQSGDPGQGSGGCAALVAGQTVEVKLDGSKLPALVATSVEPSDAGEPEIQAPLQAADANAKTVQVLGLPIDVSGALSSGQVEGDDDGGTPSQPIDLGTLMTGQSVQVKLDANKLPALVATSLEVKNFSNQVEVEVDDSNGDPVDDDVSVDGTDTVTVQTPAVSGGRTKKTKKAVEFHTLSKSGSFTLSGLPTGKATIIVTRTANNSTAHKRVTIRANTTRPVRVRLRSH